MRVGSKGACAILVLASDLGRFHLGSAQRVPMARPAWRIEAEMREDHLHVRRRKVEDGHAARVGSLGDPLGQFGDKW